MATPAWSLSELLAPMTLADFRAEYWGRRPFATKIPDGALAWLRSELAGCDVKKVVRGNRGPLAVWFADLDGNQQNVAMRHADEALLFYDAGMTIFLVNGGTVPIMKWHRAIADEVGYPSVAPLTTSLFLSRRSAGTRAHFDMLENFTIQLTGHKRWRVAPNPAVRNPLENWTTRYPITASLERTLEGPLPQEMPADAETFDLVEGSMLYIPRGHFHDTDATQDSAALFLGMPVVAWLELLLDGMRARLERLPHWRENVYGGTTPEDLARARHKMDELRAGLAADLAPMETAFLLPDAGAPLDGGRRLRRNPLAMLQVTVEEALTINVSLPLGKLGRKETFTLPKEQRPLLEWLGAQMSFTVDEVIAAHPQVAPKALRELVVVVVRAGLFT